MTLSPVLANSIVESVKQALQEDIGSGDLTALLIDESALASASIITREPAVFCGRPWASEVFSQLSEKISLDWKVQDGDDIQAGQVVCKLSGPSRPLLTGERTALNFLQTLSATATRTRQYVDAIKGTSAKILDTRKTIPGLRVAQKYAVQCGGGHNHRIGLYDGILIKENHIEASGSIDQAISEAFSLKANVTVEVEVETLDQLRSAIESGAKRILLDNMGLEELKQAVVITNKKAILEASGGVTLDNIRAVAETGVDYISIGDITKNIDAIDLSMRFD